MALIKYIQLNKEDQNDWFTIESDKEGVHWKGRCWTIYELSKYEFAFEFEVF